MERAAGICRGVNRYIAEFCSADSDRLWNTATVPICDPYLAIQEAKYAVEELNAVALIRGLRAVSDFEHEFQMAQMNRHLDDKIETIFLMPNERYFFTSSNLVKQVFKFTDRERHLIPPNVHAALSEKFGHNQQS